MLNLQQITKTDAVLLPTIFKSLEENRVFKKAEYRESFIKNINNLLSLRESRHSALSILNIFCDRHTIANSPLVTEKTCPEINLIEQLLKITEQEPDCSAECFEILGKLLKMTALNPDTNKIVQSKYVQKIIDAIVTSTVAPKQALECLALCFELHGGTSGVYKNKIYDFCASFIDVPEGAIVVRAAYCLHLIQQSRGGSVGGGVYKKCWAEFHDRNLGSLEDILEHIMKKNSGKTLGKSEQLQLPELKLSPQPFNMYTQLFIRFQNLATILEVSLKRPFTTAKTIQVGRIISFIEDGIAMSQVLLAKKAITESMVLTLLHGRIHMKLLAILQVLMKLLRQNICTHSKTICDVLWRCLKQTNGNDQMKFEANLKLRAATYETITIFVKISPNNVHVKNVMENIMKEALIDVTPASDEVCLMMPQETGKSNKKKKINAEKKLAKGRMNVVDVSHEQHVCAKALECLGALLVYQGVLMKPVLFYIMQEKITAISFMITSRTQHDGDLYRNPLCRSKLAELVEKMMTHPVNKMPVPVNYGIAILTKIKKDDPDSNVRDNAALSLHRTEAVIHNRKDVFYFPADYKDLKDTLLFNKQTVLKFNEAIHKVNEVPREVSNGTKMEIAPELNGRKSVETSDDVGELEPPPTEKVEKDSDESEAEETNEKEISDNDEPEDEEAQLEPEPEKVEEPEEEPETLKPAPLRQSSRNTKRASPPETAKKSPKKQKTSNKDDDELVDEMLADFNE